jgi:hypothetical protein
MVPTVRAASYSAHRLTRRSRRSYLASRSSARQSVAIAGDEAIAERCEPRDWLAKEKTPEQRPRPSGDHERMAHSSRTGFLALPVDPPNSTFHLARGPRQTFKSSRS